MPSAGSFSVIHLDCPSRIFDRSSVAAVSLVSASTISVKTGGSPVDTLGEPVVLTNVNTGVNVNGTYFINAAVECLDPRFNYYVNNTNLWRNQTSHTLADTNTWTINYLATHGDCDNDAKMYVANGPLQSVAELGYLVYSTNKPWCTVKLYGGNLHRVLDVFAIGTNDATGVAVTHSRRGLVNPNTWEKEALATVFADMPVDDYPGGPATPLPMGSARDVFDEFWDSGWVCTNLSDFGRGLTNWAAPFTTEARRESLFRNAFGLLSVRQNLFTIVIGAHVAKGGQFPLARNIISQRAVAVVWRDPYTGEFFVRSFQWLDD
jgi:hypothetical protein